jgi:uncharacterized protein (DUF2252 family)
MSLRLRPFDLAARQTELDAARTARFPELRARKRRRMSASPHAFFRGSAPLFYEILAARPDLSTGPEADGWIVGDMHLENVGAYRTEQDATVFGLNDFDDATVGPLRLDVLRLTTSVLLAGREFRSNGAESIALARLLLDAYRSALHGDGPPKPPPGPIAQLLSRASERSKRQLLDDRAPGEKGRRRFLRPGDRYLELPPDLAREVPELLRAYVAALGSRAPSHAKSWEVEDASFRVAGTGSLGGLRIAVLVRDRSGDERIVELKEAFSSAADALLGETQSHGSTPAERVVLAMHSVLSEPPRHLAAVAGSSASFVARKLFPQEDKLKLDSFQRGAKLDGVVEAIGAILGRAHARGVRSAPPRPWEPAALEEVLDHAIELAGAFEGIYLAYTRRPA